MKTYANANGSVKFHLAKAFDSFQLDVHNNVLLMGLLTCS